MGSINPDAGPKQELDDSGYVQDEVKPSMDEYRGTAELLDLSDDVLLYIFKSLSPQDLKALGFRLGSLVLDRTLWVDVDAVSAPHGRRRVRWLLTRALGPHTKRLRLKGYAEEADGCLGYANRRLPENAANRVPQEEERYLCGGPRVYRLTQSMPRFGNGAPSAASSKCVGPRLTLSHTALRMLSELCPELTVLELEHCVIDCQTTTIGLFPKTLKKLSLKGTKCFNLETKSFLFKIQDHLVELEELDVSYCSWIEPACMLPLSKMAKLRSLCMRECHKLAEFVAYASLATRYGFKNLEHLDLRGSPVGDSEVSALGWLPRLASLLLSPAPAEPRATDHAHYAQDLLPADKELEEWEEKEPPYFKPPIISEEDWTRDEDDVGASQSRYYANCEDPAACILLERMIAEPVNPDEYAQVYHQFLAGHNNNVPLASPEEYRESYRQFMLRPTHGHPPAGYSLFIRRAPASRKRSEPSLPGTSTQDDAVAGTSHAKPDSDSDSKEPKRRTRWGPERRNDSDSDSDGPPSKKNKDDRRQPRRVFEITINELNRGQYQSSAVRDEVIRGPETMRHQSCQTVDLIPCDAGTLVVDSAMQTERFRPYRHRRHSRSHSRPDKSKSGSRSRSSRDGKDGDGSSRSEAGGSRRSDEAGSSRSEAGGSRRSDEAGSSRSEAGCSRSDAGSSRSEAGDSKRSDEAGTSRSDGASGSRSAEAGGSRSEAGGSRRSDDADGSERDGAERARGSKRANDSERGNGSEADGLERASRSRSADVTIDLERADEGGSERANEADERNDVPSGSKRSGDTNGMERDDTDRKSKGKRSGKRSRKSDDGRSPGISKYYPTDEPSTSKRSHDTYAPGSRRSEPGSSKNEARDERRDRPTERRIFQFRQYRRPIVIEEFINVGDRETSGVLPRGVLFPGCPTRLDPTALVSDSSIRRFGRAIGENINYIHIGGGNRDTNARPDRSSLRELTVTGFRHVTDASLTHLATAAPLLQRLDVSGTGVTSLAVERFKAIRPDVEVISDAK